MKTKIPALMRGDFFIVRLTGIMAAVAGVLQVLS